MGRPKKQTLEQTIRHPVTVTTRDPIPTARDPEHQTRKPRRYIPANMPTVCPTCGANTRMDDGKHTDPVRRTVLEYRTCIKCGALLAAGRPMTQSEQERYCTRSAAVAEYEAALHKSE